MTEQPVDPATAFMQQRHAAFMLGMMIGKIPESWFDAYVGAIAHQWQMAFRHGALVASLPHHCSVVINELDSGPRDTGGYIIELKGTEGEHLIMETAVEEQLHGLLLQFRNMGVTTYMSAPQPVTVALSDDRQVRHIQHKDYPLYWIPLGYAQS